MFGKHLAGTISQFIVLVGAFVAAGRLLRTIQ